MDSKDFALSIAQLIHDRQGEDLAILDVSGPLVIADYFVVATARNPRQALALARTLDAAVKQGQLRRSGLTRLNVSGLEGEGHWVLLDFDLVVVHIFTPDARALYALEDLWADVPRVPFTPKEQATVAPETEPEDPWGGSTTTL